MIKNNIDRAICDKLQKPPSLNLSNNDMNTNNTAIHSNINMQILNNNKELTLSLSNTHPGNPLFV